MNLKLKTISTFIGVFMLLFSQQISAQVTNGKLDNTVVFKVKEHFRSDCHKNEITLQNFNKTATQLNVVELKKMFPYKQKEQKEGLVDLSLIYQMEYAGNFTTEEAIRMLQKLKITKYVEPYIVPELAYTPSDTIFSSQYHLTLIQAHNAWDVTKGDTNIVVGITDTGWEPNHPDLLANVKINHNDPINGLDDDGDGYTDNNIGWDIGMDDNDASWESATHGISVTGLAAAVTDNVTGVAGVGFKTRFMPIKISNAAGALVNAYQGIVYAADHDCFVINCSWGSFSYTQFGQDIVDYATINKGCLVVGAVGNNNLETTFYPAGYKGVLSVANSNQSDLKSASSNYGYYVDVSAPGEGMWTTASNNSFHTNGGTSMAAPVVSGGAALLKAQFPSYNNEQIAALIQATADDLNSNNTNYIDKIGKGRLNLFNGVSANSPVYLGLTNEIITDNNDNNFLFGDTLFIETFFKNYLDPVGASTMTISSTSPFVNIIDGSANLGALGTLASASNNADKFTVEVLNGAAINELITFKVTVTNGGFTNDEYFTVILNPDYIHLTENQVSTTITSNGRIGFVDGSNTKGLGFEYDGEQLLYEAGLMIGYASNRIADAVRGVTGQDQDFGSQQNVGFNPPYVSSLDLYNVLYDAPSSIAPSNVWIEQSSYAYAPNDKYVIVTYNIDNISAYQISNMSAGIFADWDIVDAGVNKAGYDAARKMGYVHSLAADTFYAAIKLLDGGSANNYALDLDGSGGVDANGGGFTTSEKFTTLTTTRATAGGTNGADVAHVVGVSGFNLNAGEDKTIAFAIIAGDSLLDIQASADAAQIRYDNDALSVEDIDYNSVVSIYPNPTTGLISVNSKENLQQVIVRNVVGELVLTSTSQDFNIASQPNGVYFVEVITENTRYSEKVILLR
ncbi:MAG: S8 family serine peptidase [Vicingaceae bacterium]